MVVVVVFSYAPSVVGPMQPKVERVDCGDVEVVQGDVLEGSDTARGTYILH